MPDRTPPRPWRRVPAVVLAASVAFGALAAVWSVAMPLYEAPDESSHLALVLHLADGRPYPAYDGLQSQISTFRGCAQFGASIRTCPAPGEEPIDAIRPHPAAAAPDRSVRPAWDDAGGAAGVGRANQMPQHPPLYYQAMATVLRAERAVNGGPRALDQELALLRLTNALLVAPLPLLAWWSARRLGLDDPTAVGASLAVFALPMLTHIGSSLNNDNLLTLCGGVLVALLAGVVRGDRSRRTALGLGVVTGVALLTKAFAVLFPPLIVGAYLLGAGRTWGDDPAGSDGSLDADPCAAAGAGENRAGASDAAGPWWRRFVPAVVPVALVGVVTVVLSAWWYVGQRIRTGTFTPSTEDQVLHAGLQPPGFEPDRLDYAVRFATDFQERFWGSYGWYSLRIPRWEAHVLTLALAVALVSALATRSVPGATDPRGARLRVAALLVPVLALLGFVYVRAQGLYVLTSRYPFIQGRYLFAGIVGLAVVVAVGARRLAGKHTPLLLAGAAAVIQLNALRRVLAGYWGGPGLGPRSQLEAMVAWSGWPGEAVGLLGLVLVAAAGWLAWELVRRDPAVGAEGGSGRPVGSITP